MHPEYFFKVGQERKKAECDEDVDLICVPYFPHIDQMSHAAR